VRTLLVVLALIGLSVGCAAPSLEIDASGFQPSVGGSTSRDGRTPGTRSTGGSYGGASQADVAKLERKVADLKEDLKELEGRVKGLEGLQDDVEDLKDDVKKLEKKLD